jgi:cytosine permease
MSTAPQGPTKMDTPAPVALPDYLAKAQPTPLAQRAPWYLNTAPTYAGIFLWFVFWDEMPYHGRLYEGGLIAALVGVVLAGLICHFAFYLVPALLGKRTGLPLYIVGTSTFGTVGGLLMPGLLMGLLQFGWLAVNGYFSSKALVGADNTPAFYLLCVAWIALAAFVGLKGIQYVAKVATFLPLIPLAVLLFAAFHYAADAPRYQPRPTSGDASTLFLATILAMVGQIVGFFATAGAAGVDFGMNNRDSRDVQLGGLWGIWGAIVLTAGLAVLIVAGAHVQEVLKEGSGKELYTATNSLKNFSLYPLIMTGLALASFPGACFSSFIAANSFRTVLPQINPFVSVGIGALASMVLAVTGAAGNLAGVFGLIGASFGPICGAMCMDYLLAGRRWPGPRAGFNLAGWGSWLLGFLVGITPQLAETPWLQQYVALPAVPAAPVAAFLVGAVVYALLALAGLQGPTLPYPPAEQQNEA